MKNIWVSSANVQTFLDYNPPISSIKGFGSIPSLVRNPPEKLLWIQLKFYAWRHPLAEAKNLINKTVVQRLQSVEMMKTFTLAVSEFPP